MADEQLPLLRMIWANVPRERDRKRLRKKFGADIEFVPPFHDLEPETKRSK